VLNINSNLIYCNRTRI